MRGVDAASAEWMVKALNGKGNIIVYGGTRSGVAWLMAPADAAVIEVTISDMMFVPVDVTAKASGPERTTTPTGRTAPPDPT